MKVQNVQGNYGKSVSEYEYKSKDVARTYCSLLEEKLNQKEEVLHNGNTEEAVPTGGNVYTSSEWDQMLEHFDATMDDLREQMRIEHAKRYEEHLKKMEKTREEKLESHMDKVLEDKAVAKDELNTYYEKKI